MGTNSELICSRK